MVDLSAPRSHVAATAPAIPERPTALMIRPQGRARAFLAMTRPTQIALIVMVFANGVPLALWRDGSWSLERLVAMWPALLLGLALEEGPS